MFQFAANVVLFIPFGILLPAIWKRFGRLRPTLIAGALTSACIEFTQLFSARVTAADDLLMNALGTAVGYWIVAAASKKRWQTKGPEPKTAGRDDSVELLIVAGTAFLSTILIKYTIASLVYSLPMFG